MKDSKKFIKDAAVSIVLLTGLAYFITYAYIMGNSQYYQLGVLTPSKIDYFDISFVISMVSAPVALIVFLYFVITILLVISDSVSYILINPVAISFALVSVVSIIYTGDIDLVNVLIAIIFCIFLIGLKELMKSRLFNRFPLFKKVMDENLNARRLLFIWKPLFSQRWMVLSLILLLIFSVLYNLGSTNAKQKGKLFNNKQ